MHKTIVMNRVCRVEGHGGIVVDIKDGKVTDVKMNIFEGPRFLESLVVGKTYDQVAPILMRICAICSATHTVASLMAVENAFGTKVTRQTQLLRDLLVQGGNIESHPLHLYCLVIPDLMHHPSAVTLAADYPREVKMGLELKKLGNNIQETIGGRAIHPVNAVVGGFGKIPGEEQLWDLREQLEEGLKQSLATFQLVSSMDIPDLCVSPNVYAALSNGESGYSLFGDKIILSTGETKKVDTYKDLCREMVVPHSHAKHSRFNNKPFMVGAMARIALNGKKLSGHARDAQEKLGLDWFSGNPFHNNIAQAIELIYSIEKAIEIIDELLATGLKKEKPVEITAGPGAGTGAVEAPRGTLYHSYRFDESGRLAEADVITPTAQNLANIEKDLRACAESSMQESNESITSKLEMVVRAYDPCISCAVHLLEVNFK